MKKNNKSVTYKKGDKIRVIKAFGISRDDDDYDEYTSNSTGGSGHVFKKNAILTVTNCHSGASSITAIGKASDTYQYTEQDYPGGFSQTLYNGEFELAMVTVKDIDKEIQELESELLTLVSKKDMMQKYKLDSIPPKTLEAYTILAIATSDADEKTKLEAIEATL